MTFGARRDGANDKGYYTQKGGEAEQMALSLLQQVFPAAQIKDARGDSEYQKQDVDFIVETSGWAKRCEVKYDRHVGKGNFCFEVVRIRHNSSWDQAIYTGWSIRTNTHVILIWDSLNHIMYIVYHWALVEGLQRYCAAQATLFVGTVPTDEYRTTFNIYIPHRFVRHSKYAWGDSAWQLLE